MGSFNTREGDSPYDVLIIGGGMSGLYSLYRTRQLGLRAKVIEAGTGVGGTWYWNRYPGARFDSESYSYNYSFSKEVLDEWVWTEHFAPQTETIKYINYICDKFNLRPDIQFHSRVKKASYQKETQLWELTLENDEQKLQSRFLVTAIGPLSTPTLPKIPGIEDYKGAAFHTARWPKEPVSFEGKRVGVIGTGATGIQTIQEVAKTARHLTVFQRTPNWCAPLLNSKITPKEMESIRQGYPETFRRCLETDACFIHTSDPRSTLEATVEEREAFWETLYSTPGFGIWLGNFRDILVDRKANELLGEFIARKIRQRVDDPDVADMLIPRNHGFGTRRVPLETKYYEVYNQPDVRLVDITETPIDHVTEKGIKTTQENFELDMIIYATGFDAVTGAFDAIDIEGVDGRKLKKTWQAGPKTFLGLTVEGFPNMFMIMGPHQAFGNIPRSIEFAVEWVTELLQYCRTHGIKCVEATAEGVDKWTEHVHDCSKGLLINEVDSWMTGVNKNVEGKQTRIIARYSGRAPEYRRRCRQVAADGYRDFRLA